MTPAPEGCVIPSSLRHCQCRVLMRGHSSLPLSKQGSYPARRFFLAPEGSTKTYLIRKAGDGAMFIASHGCSIKLVFGQ